MELNRAVAENIKRIRKTKKLSMERLAEEAGVSRSRLGQIERGEANPSVGTLAKIAAALKVPAEILLENDEFEPLLLVRELDNKASRVDGGKAVVRQNFPYDDVTRQESFFLDLYISAKYEPEASVPGCICYATVFMGVGMLMRLIFQLCGVLLSVMAVSRVVQMLPWPRTWLAGGLALFFYLIVSTLIGWCFFL